MSNDPMPQEILNRMCHDHLLPYLSSQGWIIISPETFKQLGAIIMRSGEELPHEDIHMDRQDEIAQRGLEEAAQSPGKDPAGIKVEECGTCGGEVDQTGYCENCEGDDPDIPTQAEGEEDEAENKDEGLDDDVPFGDNQCMRCGVLITEDNWDDEVEMCTKCSGKVVELKGKDKSDE